MELTTCGWLPKPDALRRARWQFAEGEIERAALRAEEDRALTDWLEFQESLGLAVLSDGQLDRSDPIGFFSALGGLEPGGLVRIFENRYYRRPRIVGEIGWSEPLTVERFRTASQRTSGVLRAAVTGPYSLMHGSFDEHYGDRSACCSAFADALRSEIEALVDAGAREIQIDEPALVATPGEIDIAHRALERATAPARGHARTWLHAGFADFRPVAAALVGLPVDGLLLETADSGGDLLDALAGVPVDKQLGIGVVDVHRAEVEDEDVVRERISRAVETLGGDRLWIVPDAGMRALAPAVARAKLEVMARAARSL